MKTTKQPSKLQTTTEFLTGFKEYRRISEAAWTSRMLCEYLKESGTKLEATQLPELLAQSGLRLAADIPGIRSILEKLLTNDNATQLLPTLAEHLDLQQSNTLFNRCIQDGRLSVAKQLRSYLQAPSVSLQCRRACLAALVPAVDAGDVAVFPNPQPFRNRHSKKNADPIKWQEAATNAYEACRYIAVEFPEDFGISSTFIDIAIQRKDHELIRHLYDTDNLQPLALDPADASRIFGKSVAELTVQASDREENCQQAKKKKVLSLAVPADKSAFATAFRSALKKVNTAFRGILSIASRAALTEALLADDKATEYAIDLRLLHTDADVVKLLRESQRPISKKLL